MLQPDVEVPAGETEQGSTPALEQPQPRDSPLLQEGEEDSDESKGLV